MMDLKCTIISMIDDIQDGITLYSDEKPRMTRVALFAAIAVIWLAFAALCAVLFIPGIKKTAGETEIFRIILHLGEYRHFDLKKDVDLFFVSGQSEPQTVKVHTNAIPTNFSDYHDVLEALFQGPPDEALDAGLITYIPKTVKFLGVTVSCGTAFVNVSEDLGNDSEIASKQIIDTLSNIDGSISNLVILINGTVKNA